MRSAPALAGAESEHKNQSRQSDESCDGPAPVSKYLHVLMVAFQCDTTQPHRCQSSPVDIPHRGDPHGALFTRTGEQFGQLHPDPPRAMRVGECAAGRWLLDWDSRAAGARIRGDLGFVVALKPGPVSTLEPHLRRYSSHDMILNETQRRALSFIQAANHGGYSPTPVEVMEWVERPDPLPGKVTRRVVKTPGVQMPDLGPSLAASSYFEKINRDLAKTMEVINRQVTHSFKPIMPQLAALSGIWESERAVEERDPDEVLIEQLKRLHWIEPSATGAGLVLTALGRALLRQDTDQATDAEIAVLDGDDPLAWGSLIGTIADVGACLIVDPYLKPDQFLDVAGFTGATRVILTRPKKESEKVAWQMYQTLPGMDIIIRFADRGLLHDRYIVGENHVYLLGCSLNGVGRKPTTLVPVSGPAADRIREITDGWWEAALPVGDPPMGQAAEQEPGGPDADDGGEAT